VWDGSPGQFNCSPHSTCKRDVIIVDQHSIIQPEAVIVAAADGHRVLLQQPQTGCSPGCVDDTSFRPADAIYKFTSERGDAGQSLQQI
jgi:hypothetical protein